MLCSVHGTCGTLMGAVLCMITKIVTYQPHWLCSRYGGLRWL